MMALDKGSEQPVSVASAKCSRLAHGEPSETPCFATNDLPDQETGSWRTFGATRECSPSEVSTSLRSATNPSPGNDKLSWRAFEATSQCSLQQRFHGPRNVAYPWVVRTDQNAHAQDAARHWHHLRRRSPPLKYPSSRLKQYRGKSSPPCVS